MNSIRKAYEQGYAIRGKFYWRDDEWIKKHSDTEAISEKGCVYNNSDIDFDFDENPQEWEIYKPDIKQAIQNHINSIQNLLNSL